ncbi:transglutaminase-like cysteine peptidase [Phenylobacterium sp.]|uniref:transglutaminase-like cysteine peptidase n=1 Tax=Phenylobacterium sp. TaxID=1871053 RepID=UPI0030F3FDB6
MLKISNSIAAVTALICALSHSNFALAGAPAASGPMPLGAAIGAPRAYLEYCGRQPRDCQVSREMVLSQTGAFASGDRATTAAITRPKLATSGPNPAITRMTSQGSFSFNADTTEQVNWLRLIGDGALVKATPVGQARLSFANFSFAPDDRTPKPEASPAASSGATLVVDSRTWATINRVNTKINRQIIRKTDFDNNGVEERWSTPLAEGGKFGDCEDYVLEKRRALIAEGFPPSALSIAVVTTSWNTGHAVLLVAGDKGEYVLDNLSPWIVPWNEAPYTFRKRQVAGDAFRWAWIEKSSRNNDGAQPLLIARAD